MAISENRARQAIRRLHVAHSRLLEKHPFYAVLLLKMKYSLDEKCDTAYTDGTRIAFSPDFMDSLTDSELDFVLMHEVLHVVLSHCARTQKEFVPELFNIACDIVVNSNILLSNDMDISTITIGKYGESMHTLPDGSEGYLYTAEDVYRKLVAEVKSHSRKSSGKGEDTSFDDHGKWQILKGDGEDGDASQDALDEMNARLLNAYEAVKALGKTAGNIPAGIERAIGKLIRPQTDWRTVLNDFVQTEINDYSFMPPDRRLQDQEFFLPDFNEEEDFVQDILFMIDTSGSMSEETVTACFSEIRGAIDQFNGRLAGYLGYFDAAVVPPVEFSSVDELQVIKPVGGGGTSFACVFDYIRDEMQDRRPAAIVILTDGEAPFPEESASDGIPVLWVVTTDKEIPWGKVTRITDV